MKSFEFQKMEVRELHRKYEGCLISEYRERNYLSNLGDPNNFVEGIYYHQVNSEEDKKILSEWI